MLRFLTLSLLAISFLAMPSPSLAAEITGIEIISAGIFKARDTSVSNDVNLPTGKFTRVTEVSLVESTDRIPAKLGIYFGIAFKIKGKPAGENVSITRNFITPGLQEPGNNKVYTTFASTVVYPLDDETRYLFYNFEQPWELEPGEWTLQLLCEGKHQTAKTFIVYKP